MKNWHHVDLRYCHGLSEMSLSLEWYCHVQQEALYLKLDLQVHFILMFTNNVLTPCSNEEKYSLEALFLEECVKDSFLICTALCDYC